MKMENTSAPQRPLGPAMQACLDAAEDAGRGGMTCHDVADILRVSAKQASATLHKCRRLGLLVAVLEPADGGRNLNRWYLPKLRPSSGPIEMYPRRHQAPTSVATGVAARLEVVVVRAGVIDSRECRPWAAAAAECIGGAK